MNIQSQKINEIEKRLTEIAMKRVALEHEVIICDYVDRKIGMTAKMFERRLKGYRAIGYRISDENELSFSTGCFHPSGDA